MDVPGDERDDPYRTPQALPLDRRTTPTIVETYVDLATIFFFVVVPLATATGLFLSFDVVRRS